MYISLYIQKKHTLRKSIYILQSHLGQKEKRKRYILLLYIQEKHFSNSIVTIYRKNTKLSVLSLYTNYLPGENKKKKRCIYSYIYIEKQYKISLYRKSYQYSTIYKRNTIYLYIQENKRYYCIVSIYTTNLRGKIKKKRDIYCYIYRKNTYIYIEKYKAHSRR